MKTPPALAEVEAARLDRLAAQTGDARFRQAAGCLRGNLAGRQQIDDDEALSFAAAQLAAGLARSRRDACVRSARLYAPDRAGIRRMVDRLQRKIAKKPVG